MLTLEQIMTDLSTLRNSQYQDYFIKLGEIDLPTRVQLIERIRNTQIAHNVHSARNFTDREVYVLDSIDRHLNAPQVLSKLFEEIYREVNLANKSNSIDQLEQLKNELNVLETYEDLPSQQKEALVLLHQSLFYSTLPSNIEKIFNSKTTRPEIVNAIFISIINNFKSKISDYLLENSSPNDNQFGMFSKRLHTFHFDQPQQAIKNIHLNSLSNYYPNLTSLSLKNVKIISLESIDKLSQLEEIELYNNELSLMPECISKLLKLRKLAIKKNPNIYFSDSFSKLEITSLKISKNKMRDIPDEILLLKNLTCLDLSKNKIVKIPSTITKLRELKFFNLSSNEKIKSLPREISKLKKLKVLDLSSTSINTVTDQILSIRRLTSLGEKYLTKQLTILRGLPIKHYQIKTTFEDDKYIIGREIDLIKMTAETIKMHNKITSIQIEFNNSSEFDEGGMFRDFLCKILLKFKSDYTINGTITPRKDVDVDIGLLISVGRILAFCYRSQGEFPAGKLFNKEMYDNIVSCPDHLISKPFNSLTFNELNYFLLDSYKKVSGYSDIIKYMNASDKEKDKLFARIKELATVFGVEINDKTDEIESLLKMMKEEIIPIAKPIYYVIKGFSKMTLVWNVRKNIINLCDKTQGRFSRKELINSLDCGKSEKINEYKKWVIAWIRARKREKVQDLLQRITGSRYLSLNSNGEFEKIYIDLQQMNMKGNHILTCTRTLFLKSNLKSQVEAFEQLDLIATCELGF